MTERCSTCSMPLVWTGGRLVCPNANCPGHDLTAAAGPPSGRKTVRRERWFMSANPPATRSVGGYRATRRGGGSKSFSDTPRHSRQHVGRLVRGEQRPEIADPDVEGLVGDVTGALEAFLDDVDLGVADDVLAATARALAAKLDACGASESATAAQAAPRIAAQLVALLGELRVRVPREPDALDLIRAQRNARRAALAARHAARNGDGAA